MSFVVALLAERRQRDDSPVPSESIGDSSMLLLRSRPSSWGPTSCSPVTGCLIRGAPRWAASITALCHPSAPTRRSADGVGIRLSRRLGRVRRPGWSGPRAGRPHPPVGVHRGLPAGRALGDAAGPWAARARSASGTWPRATRGLGRRAFPDDAVHRDFGFRAFRPAAARPAHRWRPLSQTLSDALAGRRGGAAGYLRTLSPRTRRVDGVDTLTNGRPACAST